LIAGRCKILFDLSFANIDLEKIKQPFATHIDGGALLLSAVPLTGQISKSVYQSDDQLETPYGLVQYLGGPVGLTYQADFNFFLLLSSGQVCNALSYYKGAGFVKRRKWSIQLLSPQYQYSF